MFEDDFDILEAFKLDLRPKYILPSLLKAKVISEEERTIILEPKVPRSQVTKLWNILKEKPFDISYYLEEALREEDSYPWLADLIDDKQYKNLLVDGGVPFETNNLVIRDEIFKIRMYLLKKKRRKWILLHGMRGNGKAVLAAEAVRNAALIKNNYSKGVFWISVGNLDNDMSLLLKMESLYEMLHGDHDFMNTVCGNNLCNYKNLIKKFRRILRCEIKNRNYEVLVILHDVWTQDVIDAFDIGCSILVTTNKQDICEKFSSFTHKVSCEEGLTLEESKHLLASYANCEVNALPEAVKSIYIKCEGSPLLLTRIGIMMSPYGSDKNHWNRIKEKLLDPKEGIRTTIKDRVPCKDISSIFKKNLHFCLESFKDSKLNLHQHFYDLGIFPENVDIPKKVLSVFWAKEDTDVEDIMNNLYQISLVQKKGDHYYRICGIYLELIRDTVDLQEHHVRFVMKLIDACKTSDGHDFGKLPNHKYFYSYIGYHLTEAKKLELLEELYTDLNFIKKTLRFCGPGELLSHFLNYKENFKKGVHDDFVKFLKKNVYLLMHKDSDIIQLAFLEPNDSAVHKKAIQMSKKSQNKVYFMLSDSSCEALFANKLKRQSSCEEIRFISANHDGTVVACVSWDASIKFWCVDDDFSVVVPTEHRDYVNHCTFNSDGKYLITASSDCTVKIFEFNIEKIRDCLKPFEGFQHLRTFSEHQSEVLSCSYSHNDTFIASGDLKNIILVWNPADGNLKCKLQNDINNKITFCCFNPFDTICATVANDKGKINLWSIESGKCIYEFPSENHIVKSLYFIENGEKLISASDCHVVMFDISNYSKQEPAKIYIAPKFYITCCDLSPDKRFLACGTALGYVFILDVKLRNISMEFLLQEDSFKIQNVIFSKDGKKLFCSTSSAVTVHQIPDESWFFTRQKLCTQFNGKKFLTTVNHRNCIEVIPNLNSKLKWKSPEIKDVTAFSVSNDLSEMVCGTKDGIVKVFNIINKIPSVTNELEPHLSAVNYITHSKNGLSFFTCSDDKTVQVWRKKESSLILDGHSDSVVMCVPFVTRNHLLSCCKDGTLRVWDITSAATIFELNHNNSKKEEVWKSMFCDVSADENVIVSVSSDVKVWCAKKGELLEEISMSVMYCKFSPFPLKYIPEQISKDLLVRDIQHEEKDYHIVGLRHSGMVHDFKMAQDGRKYMTVDNKAVNNNIKIWNMHEKRLESSLPGRNVLWANDNLDLLLSLYNYKLCKLKCVQRKTNNIINRQLNIPIAFVIILIILLLLFFIIFDTEQNEL